MKPTSYWRRQAQPIIARVLAESAGLSERAIRKALREAYPFGQRSLHPYRIWCDEAARQRGLKPPLGSLTKRARVRIQEANHAQLALGGGK